MKYLTLTSVAFVGLALTARGDDHWWHRHHRVVEPVIDVRVYHGGDSYRHHHHSIEADVQIALARRGYYRGPIDGDIGHYSRVAIAAYQRDHGMRPSGEIDHALLRSLGI